MMRKIDGQHLVPWLGLTMGRFRSAIEDKKELTSPPWICVFGIAVVFIYKKLYILEGYIYSEREKDRPRGSTIIDYANKCD
jgi:hypothetical protein